VSVGIGVQFDTIFSILHKQTANNSVKFRQLNLAFLFKMTLKLKIHFDTSAMSFLFDKKEALLGLNTHPAIKVQW
jgi:hypothetical protein